MVAVLITQLPHKAAATAAFAASSASGSIKALKTTPLLSVEESIDAMRKAGEASYRAPG